MKQKIWKNKKGGLLGGAITSIVDFLQMILHLVPAPIRLALFILLITTFATFIIPAFLNLFGYECVTENNQLALYKVPMSSLLAKSMSDARQTVRRTVGLSDYQLPDDPFPNGDKRYIRVPDNCLMTTQLNGSEFTGYTARCTNCSFEPFQWYNVLFGLDDNRVCVGDGYANVNVWSYSLEYRQFCYLCAPPHPYFYNHTQCLNNPNGCLFQIEAGYNPNDVLESYDYYLIRIKELGGVKIPIDDTEIVNIQCRAYNQPAIYFFDVEIFNKTLWIILIIGFGLVSFAFAWYGVILK